jgi:hypothetical protein
MIVGADWHERLHLSAFVCTIFSMRVVETSHLRVLGEPYKFVKNEGSGQDGESSGNRCCEGALVD